MRLVYDSRVHTVFGYTVYTTFGYTVYTILVYTLYPSLVYTVYTVYTPLICKNLGTELLTGYKHDAACLLPPLKLEMGVNIKFYVAYTVYTICGIYTVYTVWIVYTVCMYELYILYRLYMLYGSLIWNASVSFFADPAWKSLHYRGTSTI
jgi:hypothetical protein